MGCSAGWFVAGLVGATSLLAAGLAGAAEISFDRDVRPILAEHCFACHGPDAGSRAAELRLDLREGALADRDGVRAVVPGNGGASELVTRIRSTDPDVRVARNLAALFNPALFPGVGQMLRITQQELAYLVGLSRQRVNVALNRLQEEGSIRIEYGGMRVLNLTALRESGTLD